ncbi:MAG: 50S ribosome-binding GTPase [Methylococcales bacterium]|nr:50S ribosome-binding GTPase [Methylococcales bacterium]
MLEFITLLRQRYQIVLNSNTNEMRNYQHSFEQLTLAEAFFRKGQLVKTSPLHIVIIGPTQAGKSSLTNAFLQSQNAGVSPLAGYTVHPQGFCHNLDLLDCKDLADYFMPFVQISSENLRKNCFNNYSLEKTENVSHFLPPAIFWDTPDFDSIDSTDYREGVLKTIALADVIILVVSKEKYADQTVWDTLKIIEPLRQPTLICVNKLNEDSEAIILESLKEKWHDYRRDIFPEIISLLYQQTTKSPEIPESKQHILFELTKKVQREKQKQREQKLVQTHWQEWTKPLRIEHEIYSAWQTLVDDVMGQTLKNYEHDYLNHPHHYETFQQAIAELLLLLEIPGVAKVMMTTRKVLLYPLKLVRRLGKSRNHPQRSHEMTVLTSALNHTLTELAHELLDKNTHSMWRELSEQLRKNRAAILNEFQHETENYHQNFQQNVERAAQGLYSKLEEQPLVLNTLRATRITADAVVVALTLYTGGIGLHDLAIAPAMLMLTNLLTESVIGSYMKKIETDLKAQQLAAVKLQVFTPLAQRLHALPQHLKTKTHFAISPEQLAIAETKFNEKPHGLRLL